MSLEIQPAVVMHLSSPTTATHAIAGESVFWASIGKDPTPPFVRVFKSAFRSQASGLKGRRLPGQATVTVVSFAKSQQLASELANAFSSDLIGYNGIMPNTSPPTAGALHVAGIEPGTEEDVMSSELYEKNLFAEARDFLIDYR